MEYTSRPNNEELTEDELKFLAAVERTKEETTVPPDVKIDVRAVAARAFAAYLESDGKQEDADTQIIVTATAGINRTVSELLNIKPVQEFRRDFFSVIIPTLMLLGGWYFFFRMKGNTSYLWGPNIVVFLLFSVALALTFSYLKYHVRMSNSFLKSLRYSVGALVGVLASLAILLGVGNYSLRQNWIDTKLEGTKRDIADVAFMTVGGKKNLQGETQLNLSRLDNTAAVIVETNENGEIIKIEAKAKDVPIPVIAEITPKRANIYSSDPTQPDYKILTGKIRWLSENAIEINPDEPDNTQQIVKLNFNPTIVPSHYESSWTSLNSKNLENYKDKDVKVLYSTKSGEPIKMIIANAEGSHPYLYNSAVSDLIVKPAGQTAMPQ